MTDRHIGILGLFKKDKQQDEIFKGWHYKAVGPAGKTDDHFGKIAGREE